MKKTKTRTPETDEIKIKSTVVTEKTSGDCKISNPCCFTEGTILKGVGGKYSVYSTDNRIFSCSARGVFRHEKIKPLAGDRIRVILNDDENHLRSKRTEEDGSDGAIDEIFPRKNVLIRPPLANLDKLFVIIASAYPEPSTVIADKLITISEFNDIEPVIVVSKSDLDEAVSAHIKEIYLKCGFTVFETSSEKSEGIEALRDYIADKCRFEVSSFAGVSGSGKSTLMNALFPSLFLEIGALSEKIGRGKNTTRTSELFPLCLLLREDEADMKGGFIADTPGFSMIDFTRFNFYKLSDLPYNFREFRPLLTHCRYSKCTHTKEEGCAILEAVHSGELPYERHQSYLNIFADLKDKHDWD